MSKRVREKTTKVQLALREAADLFVFNTFDDSINNSVVAANSIKIEAKDASNHVVWECELPIRK